MALDLFRVSGGIQIDDSTQILEGAGVPAMDAPVGSVYTNTTTGGLYTKVAAGSGTDKWELQALKSYVDTEITNINNAIAALGNAFNYVGTLTGGVDGPSAFDMDTLPAGSKDAGDYYKVTTAGYFKVGVAGTPFFANVGDGLVFNTSAGVDKIDNTNSEVQGTTNFVSVTGSTDSGFVVDIDSNFKGRMTTAESNISSLDTRVTTAEGDITSLETRMTTAEGNITTLQTSVTNLDTRLTTAEADIVALEAADVALDSRLDTAEGDIVDLRSFVGAADGDTAPTYSSTVFVTQNANLEAAIGQLDGAVDTVSTNLTNLETTVNNNTLTTSGASVTTLSDTLSGAVAAKWIVHIQSGTDMVAYEVFAGTNGTSVDYTKFAVLKLGSNIAGVNVTVTMSGADMMITAVTAAAANMKIKRVSVV